MPQQKKYYEIPSKKPDTPLLDCIQFPSDLRKLDASQLPQLCDELRLFLLYSVGQSGGHFGAGLGVIELTVALHYVFDTPNDQLIWDVGHQAYPHKILTGRRESLINIRKVDGLTAFPTRSESEYDAFGVGHSSTSVSAALGMALAFEAQQANQRAIAVIGDGAMTAGMVFEALNHAGHEKTDLLVILNDNDMSISNNVGGLNKYLTRLLSSETFSALRGNSKKVLEQIPGALDIARRAEDQVKGIVRANTLFEELGFHYFGPVNGHDIFEMISLFENLKKYKGPVFLHLATQKGHGFQPAEQDPIKYHALKSLRDKANQVKRQTFSNVFGRWICDLAAQDERVIAITPAMREGSDLIEFSKTYPKRYFDVAIAEQHAVTLAAGMATQGMKPVVAIYSTFLQRAYDQLLHDVAIQNLDVLFAIDRAGLVGEDGATHQGVFDISYLRCVPNLIIMTPCDEQESRLLLQTGYEYQGPAAVRYPRGVGPGVATMDELKTLPIGKSECLRKTTKEKDRVAFLVFGTMLEDIKPIAQKLDASLLNMRFVKPLDEQAVLMAAKNHDLLVCVEDNAKAGGAGSAVLECLAANLNTKACLLIGVEDTFIDQGSVEQQRKMTTMSVEQIEEQVKQALAQLS